MNDVPQPHDRFFNKMFSNPEMVEDILFNNIPEIATHLMKGSLESTGESFVNSELRKYMSDLLYRARLQSGEKAYVYILFEHKSYPDPKVSFDLLRYMVRIWERLAQSEGGEHFAHIIPVVFYHGKQRWRGGTNFSRLFRDEEALKEFVPAFEFRLYDLSRYNEEEIKGGILSRVVLLLFKYIFEEDFGDRFVRICRLLRALGQEKHVLEFMRVVLEYVGNSTDRIGEEQLRQGVQEALPLSGGELMPTLFEKIRGEGREEGRQEGREEGRQEGLREAIRVALESKFGDEGLSLFPRVKEVSSCERLQAIIAAVYKAETLSQLESLL